MAEGIEAAEQKVEQQTAEVLPWFDLPDAMDVLASRHRAGQYSDAQAELLKKWITDGYVLVQDLVNNADIDEMLGDLENIWTATEPTPGLTISINKNHPDDPPEYSHETIVAWDAATRRERKERALWRVHGFFQYSAATRRIFDNAALLELTKTIFNHPSQQYYTINFMYGSQQALHQDINVFAVVPRNYLIGAWLACEEIDPGSGPLVYYPGSHRERMFGPFDENYPQSGLKTCDRVTGDAYRAHVATVAKKYPLKHYCPRKGEILLWHGMLIHGGAEVTKPGTTRKSYVAHYLGAGMDRMYELVGPFNW